MINYLLLISLMITISVIVFVAITIFTFYEYKQSPTPTILNSINDSIEENTVVGVIKILNYEIVIKGSNNTDNDVKEFVKFMNYLNKCSLSYEQTKSIKFHQTTNLK